MANFSPHGESYLTTRYRTWVANGDGAGCGLDLHHSEKNSQEASVACSFCATARAGEHEGRIGVPFVHGYAHCSAKTQHESAFR